MEKSESVFTGLPVYLNYFGQAQPKPIGEALNYGEACALFFIVVMNDARCKQALKRLESLVCEPLINLEGEPKIVGFNFFFLNIGEYFVRKGAI